MLREGEVCNSMKTKFFIVRAVGEGPKVIRPYILYQLGHLTSHIYILLSIIWIFIQKGVEFQKERGGGILCRKWDDRHRGSSDFFEMGKMGKEHPVVIALLIWAMGNQSIIYYIVI